MLEKGDIKQRGLFSEPPSSRFSDLTIRTNIAENELKSKSYPQGTLCYKKTDISVGFFWIFFRRLK